ncbi:hypothetical protein FSP39_010054 [Pinctada imbricata]|uniref:Protein N-lysine methyltransferase METTL21A n=1 Tax=Pinctada imbricata TaxID=66713 RepID=A0AA88XCS9_PINIB|nr:hypothetical protein FSP39_010054 [Pinctada imbricata]
MSDAASQCTKIESEKTRDKEVSWALLPYVEQNTILPEFYERKRTFHFAGHSIEIEQDWQNLGVAGVVWDAAIVLCRYLEEGKINVRGKAIMELGAGSGIVGILAALLGGRVTITEREVAMPYLSSVVNANMENKPDIKAVTMVQQLDWEKDLDKYDETFDVILGADVIYIEDVFPALLKTLEKLSDKRTEIYISCRIRYERDRRFLQMLKDKFIVSKVYVDIDKDVRIYKAIKR